MMAVRDKLATKCIRILSRVEEQRWRAWSSNKGRQTRGGPKRRSSIFSVQYLATKSAKPHLQKHRVIVLHPRNWKKWRWKAAKTRQLPIAKENNEKQWIHADFAKRKRRNIEKDTQTTNRKGEKRKERHADNNLTSKDEQQKPEQKKPIFPLNTFHHSPHLHFEEFIVYNDEHAIFWFIMLSIPNILGRLPYDIIFGIKPNALDLVQEDHANRTPDILRLFPDWKTSRTLNASKNAAMMEEAAFTRQQSDGNIAHGDELAGLLVGQDW